MTQLNTPYPATAYLTGFLRGVGYDVRQADPAIALVLKLFSKQGLQDIRQELIELTVKRRLKSAAVRHFLANAQAYEHSVDAVVSFLQGQNSALAFRINSGDFLPEGPRFHKALSQFTPVGGDPLSWAFGALGANDRAKYLASLYLDDLADVIREGIDPRFELTRYGEKLAASAPSFQPLAAALAAKPSLVDRYLDELTSELLVQHRPDVVGLTVPFPGNVYGAFRMAQTIKRRSSGMPVVMGGGYVNTELRSLRETRVFDFVDFVTLDDGEKPLLTVLEHLAGRRSRDDLLRTFVREDGRVVLKSQASEHDIPLRDAGTPTYDGLPSAQYLSLLEMLNPMHRIWSDGRWNKLTLAHGCYWKRCNFCDISLDYIGRYEEQSADLIIDRILRLKAETGQSGFHFVDEAAPPKVLLAMADRLIERNIVISWWGNIRFERTFALKGVAERLKASGCIALSGGLEVADERLLKLMQKGVTVEQVARVTHALSQAGILVHAYLMYGFPTQTAQETVDALERVRQLFQNQCLSSAYWHRFSTTVHSPIGRDPARFGITLKPMPEPTFAQNDLLFDDPTGVDHDLLGFGLRKAVYNYMHGVGLDEDVRFWFDRPVAKAKVPANFVAKALKPGRLRRA